MRNYLAAIGVFSIVLGTAVNAHAWLPPTHTRCAYDFIGATADANTSPARGRYLWALDGRNATMPRNTKYLSNMAFDEIDGNPTFQLYPVYTYDSTGYVWIGPTGANRDVVRYSGVVKPADARNDAVCEAGCYTPDQTVRFSGGLVPIRKAVDRGMVDVVTLTPEATFDALSFFTNHVASYTVDKIEAEQTIVIFRMKSGGELKVTTEHPIVTADGSLQQARDFQVGESFVREDGTPDEIVSISNINWFGKAYNLKPKTTDLTSNILVAQGYLNGSARYQSEFLQELNRIILRENIPEDVIPSKK